MYVFTLRHKLEGVAFYANNAKLEKCILARYLHEQKEYKWYNSWTKQVQVSREVMFNESTS